MTTQVVGNELALARTLREALWATGIAYGEPPRLWRVSPKWYHLWETQWEQVLAFGQLLPSLRRALDGDDGATYLRADFTLDSRGRLVLVELNDTPVWDYGTQAVRAVYHEVLGMDGRTVDPFPGAAKAIVDRLKGKFASRRIVVLLSPDRVSYAAEYGCLAAYGVAQGLQMVVSREIGEVGEGDVVYRTFNRDWLRSGSGWADVDRLAQLVKAGAVTVWPPLTHLEDKVWMTYPFGGVSANGLISGFNGEPLSRLRGFVPPTCLVDPTAKGVPSGKRLFPWHANELSGDLTNPNPKKPEQPTRHHWVLKRALGAQGKGTAFSSWIGPEEWRGRLMEALFSVNGRGPHYVIQPEVPTLRHKVTFLNGAGDGLEEAGDYRVRLCVAYLVEGNDVQTIDADATLLNRPLVHGSSDAVALPVVVRVAK